MQPGAGGAALAAEPGELLDLGFEEAVAAIADEIERAVLEAPEYELQRACVPSHHLLLHLQGIVDGTARAHDSTWHGVTGLRIRETWNTRHTELIWLDDKVAQVARAGELCGRGPLHVPLLAHAAAGEGAPALETVLATVRRCVAEDQPIAVKPRHGANGAFVRLWLKPKEVGEAPVLASVEAAISSQDQSWSRECWQLSQVPRGVVVQPLYRTQLPVEPGAEKAAAPERPLELRLHVLFGSVVGAVVTGSPFELWVRRGGAVQRWRPEDLKAKGVPGSHKHSKRLTAPTLHVLVASLQRAWPHLLEVSERLVQEAGLDELRVDWLLGDARWGPRIGELTYMGAGSSVQIPGLTLALARAYAAAHLRRQRLAAGGGSG